MASRASTDASEGHEQWYSWSEYFPRGFRIDKGGWMLFTQWHHVGNTCPVPMYFHVSDGAVPHILLQTQGGAFNPVSCTWQHQRSFDLGVLPTGRWTDFRVHVKWSSKRLVGFVRVGINGRTALQQTSVANLYKGQGVYLKQGIYRSNMRRTSTVYLTGTVRGNSPRSVALR